MLFIYAQCFVQPSKVDEFLKLNEVFVRETQKEEGCVSFNIGKMHDSENVFTYIEKFKDEEALKFHHNTKHFLELGGPIRALMEKPIEAIFYDVVDI